MSKSNPSFRVAVLAVLVLATGVASASPELKFESRPPVPTDKDKSPAPSLLVRIKGGPAALGPEVFTLRQTDARLPAVKATQVIRYTEGPEPLGLVVLVQGDPRYLSGLKGLEAAIEGGLAGLTGAGPAGSQALVLLYGAGVEPRGAVGPLEQLGNVKLAAKPATGKAGRDLGGAITKAIAELDKMTTPRKALLVIGDGIDGDGGKEPSPAMAALAKQLEGKEIITFAVVVQVDDPALGAPVPPPAAPETPLGVDAPEDPAQTRYDQLELEWRTVKDKATGDMKTLTAGNMQKVTSPGNLDTAILGLGSLLDDRYYVVFPGYDPLTKGGFTWDGKEHPLMLRIDGQDTTAVGVTLAPGWSPPGKGTAWWIFALIAGGALVVIGGVIAIVKKPKPLPPPPPPVLAPPPPQQPQQRQKTMFVAADGGDSVFPMVGWVVFMNGPKRLKFHRIKQGVTKIGTGANSDVVIDDGYMSTDHSMIVMTPEGFWLQDNNSTNGTFLNDAKLGKKEELYDNDLILVGKTVLKFKSVM